MSWFNKEFRLNADPDGRYTEDRKVQPVKTYKLTPEELEKYQNMDIKPEKAPAFIGLEHQTRREKKEMDKKSIRLTRDTIIEEFRNGKTTQQIAEEYGKAEFWIRGQLTRAGVLEPRTKEPKNTEKPVNSTKKFCAKKFYISSAFKNAGNVKRLASLLETIGWEQAFDWTKYTDTKDFDAVKIAEAEMQGIRDADIVIVLLPGGYGTHAELGAANILGKKVYLWAGKDNADTIIDRKNCIFYFNKNVEWVSGKDLLDLLNVLLKKECCDAV